MPKPKTVLRNMILRYCADAIGEYIDLCDNKLVRPDRALKRALKMVDQKIRLTYWTVRR